MTPNAVKAAMARLASSALLLAAAFVSTAPAFAGDAAQIDFIGFSENKRFFAFEEFGIRDGSGGPYSSVYVIDLETDSWAGGAPFTVSVDDETAKLGDIRAGALAKAKPAIDRLQLSFPAEILALRADADPQTGDSTTIGYGPYGPTPGQPTEIETLQLTTFEAPSKEDCASYGVTSLGFALSLTKASGTNQEIHRDTIVPASRGCALSYKLYAVVAPFYWQWNADQAVAIVSVDKLGFEGPDRRFIAVPIPILP